MKNNKIVSILGCGWLGKALAESLIKKNYIVKGSVTKEEKLSSLQHLNIVPFQLKLTPDGITGNNSEDFFQCNSLIISISPGRDEKTNTEFLSGIKKLYSILSGKNIHVIFISSTSVYPELNRVVVEEDTSDSENLPIAVGTGKTLLVAEKILQQEPVNATCIRFGGLIGYDRMPAKFLSGKKDLKNGNAPVNLIHRDDCVSILEILIEKEIKKEIFNACMDEHPLRKDFYTLAAKKAGLPVPQFTDDNSSDYKIVNSDKLKKGLNYSYKYKNPVDVL